MKRLFLAAAAVAAIAASGSLTATTASATPLAAPLALQGAAADLNPASEVRYVCSMVRGRYGWRRACFWRPDRRYFAPRWRRGWRR